jgi:hypothetical protein
MASQDDLLKRIDELEEEVEVLKTRLQRSERKASFGRLGDVGQDTSNPFEAISLGINKIAEGFINLDKITSGVFVDIRNAATNAAAEFGTGLKNYESISQEIAKSIPDLTRLGFEVSQIGGMQEKFTEKIQTNVVLSSDALKNIGVLDKLGANGAAIAASFRDSAQSVSGMIDELEVAGQVAGDYGVNASKIFADIEKTMQTTNQYRFENGVEGISRMAAQTAIMGISFEKVVEFADSVMNPQGAIDAVAAFQRLGVTVSGLQDPFKLMYMAQSDMEGLTEEIGKSVSNLGTFNRETGKLEIPPSARMQLKEMGDILKLGPEQMNKMVSQQAKFNAMAGDFEGLGVSEEDRMMISNLAEFNKETQQFEVKVGGETKAVTSLSDEDIKILQQRPESLEEAAFQQLDYVSSINNNVAAMLKTPGAAVAATKAQLDTERLARGMFESGGEVITKAFKDAKIREEVDRFTKEFGGSLDDVVNALKSGNVEEIKKVFGNLSSIGEIGFEDAFNRFQSSFSEGLSKIPENLSEVLGDKNIYMGLSGVIKEVVNEFGAKIKETFNTSINETTQSPIPNQPSPQAGITQAAENQIQSVGVTGSQATPSSEVPAEDFVIRTLPEDTIKVVGGTNLPPGGADITNILNNQTNNTQALTSVQPVLNRDLANLETPRTAENNRIEEKELRVKFDPFIVKLEGDGKSIEMALQDNVVRDKIIDMVGKAMTSDYNTMGRPILGGRA